MQLVLDIETDSVQSKIWMVVTKNLDTGELLCHCLLYTSPSPRDRTRSRMPSSA